MKQKQHYSELTVMSGIAILFVLGIHGCGSALNRFYADTMLYSNADILVRTLSNLVAPAVPMFLFVSGYKYALHDVDTSYPEFLRKRLPRVVMSFAIFNTLFWALDSIKYMERFDAILLLKTYLHSWVGYSVAYQLWYIPMYCFVIALCPLVRRILPSTALRFCLFAIIGIVQRILELYIPLLGTYPIRFLSYPVFFELGALARDRNWRDKHSATVCVLWGNTHVLLVCLLSWFMPEFSVHGLTKYIVYYFGGTIAFFLLSIAGKDNRFLQWTGAISYPLFLLHEPLIGKSISAVLSAFPFGTLCFFLYWISFDFLISWMVMIILQKIKCDRILWNYRIQKKM